MSKENWAEKSSNDMSLCVANGNWEIYKDGEGVKDVYFNGESIRSLPSAYYQISVYSGGALLWTPSTERNKYFFMFDNSAKQIFELNGKNISMEIDEPVITFYDSINNEKVEVAMFDFNSFEQISLEKDGQIGFNF